MIEPYGAEISVRWDRANQVCQLHLLPIADVPTEHQLWTDVMHEFLAALNLEPAYFGGASNGCVFSLYMAHRYPADVKGLLLLEPISDDLQINRPIIDSRYLEFADIAKREGMAAVIEHSRAAYRRVISPEKNVLWDVIRNWIAETIARNPENEQRLLAMDAGYFGRVMQRWGEWGITDKSSSGGLSSDKLQQLVMPALVCPGIDPLHSQAAAETLAPQLPNAQLVDYLEHYSPATIQELQQSDAAFTLKAFFMLPFIEDFLQQQQ